MPSTNDAGKQQPSYTRRRNMKKLNRAGRAKLKKRKEVIAMAEASGQDVTEALRKAGLLEDHEKTKDDKKPTINADAGSDLIEETNKSEKKEKSKKRIEQLKASKRQKKANETQQGDAAQNQQDVWADVLYDSFKSARNHTHRASSGFVASAIHPSSPVPIAMLERALTNKDTRASGLSVPPTHKARPKVLFVSPSALGALDCLKNCQGLHKGCAIAKLFAKHMKVAEQAAHLQEHPANVALGTPNRLLKLATEGHLDLSGVGVVALDMRKNPKRQSLLDIPDVTGDWWALWERFFMALGKSEKDLVQILIVQE